MEVTYETVVNRSLEDHLFIDNFVLRLRKIGVDVTLISNVPWIYIDTINGKKVTERFMAEHGFTAIFLPVNIHNKAHYSNLSEIFKLIRKYDQRFNQTKDRRHFVKGVQATIE